MSNLNIENLTKEVIREIVLERFFERREKSVDINQSELRELRVELGISNPSKTWEFSNRKTLLDIPVGGVKYLLFPRNMRRTKFRQKWLRARWSLRNKYNADYLFTDTQSALKVERIA